VKTDIWLFVIINTEIFCLLLLHEKFSECPKKITLPDSGGCSPQPPPLLARMLYGWTYIHTYIHNTRIQFVTRTLSSFGAAVAFALLAFVHTYLFDIKIECCC